MRNFDRDRIDFLEKSSRSFEVPGCKGSTIDALYYKEKCLQVFLPHIICVGTFQNHRGVITHNIMDVAILTDCPQGYSHSIDVHNNADSKLGDDILCYGFGETANIKKDNE